MWSLSHTCLDAGVRGVGCDLHREKRAEPEAGGDLPAHRGACAWR